MTSNGCQLRTAGTPFPLVFAGLVLALPRPLPLVALPECIVKPLRGSDTPIDWKLVLARTATFNIDIRWAPI